MTCYYQYLVDDVQRLAEADGIYVDQSTTEHALFHGHRTVSATELFCCRTENLERSATGTATRGHQLWTIQKHAEIVSLGFSQPRRIVTF